MLKFSKCSAVFILVAFLLAGCAGFQKTKTESDLEERISFSGLDVDLDGNNSQDIQFGGHNATTAAGARTNLGLAIGTDVLAPTGDGSGLTGITASQVGAQASNANLDTVVTPGVAGTFLKSDGTNVSWDVAGGAGGGTIGGTLGSTDNVIIRADGTGGLTAQSSLVTIDDTGTVNIPTGQTFNIAGSAHTHNYQAADADLTIWAGVTPSANGQSLVALANYAAMLSAIGAQSSDADLTAIAGLSGVRGDVIYRDATQWQRLAKGTSGKVLKMGSDDPFWGDDNNDGSSGISTFDEIGDAALDYTIAFAGYKGIFTSSLDTGAIWTFTDTDASLSAATSFFDFKYTQDGGANGFFMRGYDNAGGDLKWSIGQHGAAKFYSVETEQSATGGVVDLLEGSGAGTAYMRVKVADDITTGSSTMTISSSIADTENLTILLGANNNTVTLGSGTGVSDLSLGAINVTTTGTISGKLVTATDADAHTLTSAEYHGGTVLATGAAIYTLPTAAAGYSGCVEAGQGVTAIIQLLPASGDYVVLNGVRGTAATSLKSGGAAGDRICYRTYNADDWYVSVKGTWAE